MSEAAARPLPLALDEITPAWLTRALRAKAPGAEVRDATVVDIKNGNCTKIRLQLDLNDAARAAGIPEQVILKCGMEPHSRVIASQHEREMRGYRDIAAVLKLPSPACYFADYDPDREQGVLILEDLTVRGVRFCDPLKPEGFEATAARLSELARFHAKTWNSPEFEPGGQFDWVDPILPFLYGYMQQYLTPDVWKRFVEAPRGAACSVHFHDLDWMMTSFRALVELSKRRPHAILHGDTHLANLYFDVDGTPGFFDMLCRRGPVMHEVSYHLCGALDFADRRRWEAPLLLHYLEELGRNGVEPPPFDQALKDYGAHLATGYLIFLINESFYQPESVNTAFAARFSAAMIDHDTKGLLRAL